MEVIHQGDTKLCAYTLYDNGIHCFTFHESSFEAVEEWYQILKDIFEKATQDQPPILLMIYDGRTIGNLPFAHIVKRSKELVALYPHRPRNLSAIVARKIPAVSTMISALMPIVKLISKQSDETKFFWQNDWDTAIQWLLDHP
jgi:hypothetical protein